MCALPSTPVVRTLHDDVRLNLKGLECVADALRRLNGVARSVSDLGRFLCAPPTQEPAKPLEHADLLPTLKRLRRDMMVEGQIKGLSFVLMGLAVPTEVLAIKPKGATAVDIHFRTEGVVKDSVYMVCSLPTALGAGHHADLMHALAPAIVAFLATHKVDDAHLMDRLDGMQPTGRRLMIPPSLLAAASHDNIRDAVLAARTAFIDGGYHVAPLTHIKLAHVGSMEDWLASRTKMDVELANTAKALDDHIMAVRRRMTAALEEGMCEIERLVKRHKRALCLCMDASVAPSPSPPN